MEIENIIRETLVKHSYFASDACIAELAEKINELHAEDAELAWQYRELTK